MKIIRMTIPAMALALVGSLVSAQNEKGWVGASFAPEQCLKIQAGEFEVRRKLCRITYDIALQNEVFTIDGIVDFNKKFVPTRPKRIELELLFIDDRYVCRRQINLDKAVTSQPVSFTVTIPRTTESQYIRTYYTLYYR